MRHGTIMSTTHPENISEHWAMPYSNVCFIVQVNSKGLPATNVYRRNRGTSPHTFLTSALEVNGQHHGSAALHPPPSQPPQKEPRYPSNRRLRGPQNRSGHFEKQKNLFSLSGFEPQTIRPVAYPL